MTVCNVKCVTRVVVLVFWPSTLLIWFILTALIFIFRLFSAQKRYKKILYAKWSATNARLKKSVRVVHLKVKEPNVYLNNWWR